MEENQLGARGKHEGGSGEQHVGKRPGLWRMMEGGELKEASAEGNGVVLE